MNSNHVIETTYNSIDKLERIKKIKYVKKIKDILSTPSTTEKEKTLLIQNACAKFKSWQEIDIHMLLSENPELVKTIEKIRQCQNTSKESNMS
ncbi:MAG: hypothetical protein ACRCVE_09330 [Plesiomonas sp.]